MIGNGDVMISAQRLRGGPVLDVWVNRPLPALGEPFKLGRATFRRVLEQRAQNRKVVTNRGTEIDFSRGPVTMWTEPIQGRGAVAAPNYDKKGYAVFTNNQELREYRARCADSLRPVEWTK